MPYEKAFYFSTVLLLDRNWILRFFWGRFSPISCFVWLLFVIIIVSILFIFIGWVNDRYCPKVQLLCTTIEIRILSSLKALNRIETLISTHLFFYHIVLLFVFYLTILRKKRKLYIKSWSLRGYVLLLWTGIFSGFKLFLFTTNLVCYIFFTTKLFQYLLGKFCN